MVNSPNKYEGRGRKKLLRTQVYNISKRLGKVLAKYDKEINKSLENEPQESVKQKDIIIDNERKNIMDILGEKSDFLTKRAIVFDIIYDSTKIGEEIQFKCKYGLRITIKNFYSFLTFCSIHGFIPMIDKIYIEGQDTFKNKKIYSFYAPILSQSSNQLTEESLENEIEKLEKIFQGPLEKVLKYIEKIVKYTASTYQRLLGDSLGKLNNIGAKSENIFAEVALRLENQIRDKIGIESSYFNIADYKDDVDKKTDFKLLLRKTPYQSYQHIPMQFTVGSAEGGEKETKVEEHLIDRINKGDMEHNNFLLFFINGEFGKHISHNGKDIKSLNMKYDNWVNNPRKREETVGAKNFPMFIDTFPKEEIPKIEPAEIIYIAFHMLYKRFNFKYSLEETYLNNIKDKIVGAISGKNHGKIKGIEPAVPLRNKKDYNPNDYLIELSDICIDDCSIKKIENLRKNYPGILKHRFSISYKGEPMGVIVIYEIEPKRRKLVS